MGPFFGANFLLPCPVLAPVHALRYKYITYLLAISNLPVSPARKIYRADVRAGGEAASSGREGIWRSSTLNLEWIAEKLWGSVIGQALFAM
ncbi:MAG: hypothetical protein DRG71_10215 [Deltaproteobacteria bacterium]|nr:MAG: hypothetical protein DRG71_10215 [Deltaproteobacteria bacterium]HDG98554.1 hypothetical protein [Desulfobacterales bacterium]